MEKETKLQKFRFFISNDEGEDIIIKAEKIDYFFVDKKLEGFELRTANNIVAFMKANMFIGWTAENIYETNKEDN